MSYQQEPLASAKPMKSAPIFNIQSYLTGERAKDLLRFSTAGSVDDGKSTLIGRLLSTREAYTRTKCARLKARARPLQAYSI